MSIPNCVGWVDVRKPNIINRFVGLRYRLTQPTNELFAIEQKPYCTI
jgi:hypothetical protein